MIHKYKLNGYNIVLDVNSGGVHVVDDITFDILDYVTAPMDEVCPVAVLENLKGKYNESYIKECYSELFELYKNETLFCEDGYEKFAKYAVASPVKAMCLLIAMDCNLRCEYCFAGTGDYGEGRALMSFDTAKKAIDFLLENSKDRENLEVDFFGGEPTMNWQVLKDTVAYARSKEKEYKKNFRFTVTTNGLLLDDDKIDYINKEMNNVVLSIDGRKEVNDRMRHRVDGSGCHDKIIKNFKNLVAKRGDKEYYVRGTYTKYNLDFSNDVMHFYDEGFDQVSVEPVVTDPKMPYAIHEDDLEQIGKEYDNLALKLMDIEKKGGFCNFFHFMIDLDQGPCAIKRLRGCGCGNEYVAISTDGDIFPCHQFVGHDEWKMGNLYDGSFNNEMKDYFAKTHIYNKPQCRDCWAKFYCSGGCNANNFIYAGDVHNSYKLSCEIERKRVEVAIMLKIKRKLEK